MTNADQTLLCESALRAAETLAAAATSPYERARRDVTRTTSASSSTSSTAEPASSPTVAQTSPGLAGAEGTLEEAQAPRHFGTKHTPSAPENTTTGLVGVVATNVAPLAWVSSEAMAFGAPPQPFTEHPTISW
jgi:hypothetical protein